MKIMMMNIHLRGKYRELNTNELSNECNVYAKRVTIINTRSMYCLYLCNQISKAIDLATIFDWISNRIRHMIYINTLLIDQLLF